MSTSKKLLSLLLSLVMVIGLMTPAAMAEDTATEVDTYEELLEALENDNANIKMTGDITADATQSSGYGKAGIVLEAGDVLDGGGHTLTITGANSTWDCAIAMKGGEVKKLTIAGAMRGVFMPGANGDVVIDNCVFEDVVYTFNSDAGSKDYAVTIKNSVLNGWTSFSDVHKSVAFEGCEFGEGSGYAFCRPYQATTFTDCKFEEGFELDTSKTDKNSFEFDNCTYAEQPLSVDNGGDMFYNGGNVMVNGVSVDYTKYAAKIGDQGYLTLQEAVEAAASGDTITILAAGTYTVPTGKNLTITGAVDGVKFDMKKAVGVHSSMTFNKVSFEYGSNGNYIGLQHAGTMEYNNCTFNGQAFLYGTSETFNNCIFNQTSADAYNVWTYGAQEVEFNSCAFNSAGKSVLVYNEGATGTDLTVTNCDFIASEPVEGKAAIEIDSSLLKDEDEHKVTIDNKTTVTGFANGSVSGNMLWNDKKDLTNLEVWVNNVQVWPVTPDAAVAKINDTLYYTLQSALDAAVAGTGEVTVEVLSDIDLTNTDWNPVTVSAPGYPEVTVNGNNTTITGLNDMLFAGTWAGNSGLIINDLTIKDSTIVNDENDAKGTVGVGAFIGYPQASATITLNNCHLVDSTVKGGHWTGGLIGMAGGYNGNDGPVFMNLTIDGCSVTDSTISGKGSAGGVIGHGSCAAWTNVTITDTTVSGNTIKSTGSSTEKAGSIMGTIGAAGQPTTADGETKTGGAFVCATVSDNTVTSNGTTITTIYGRQGTETGVLTMLPGGSYDNYPINIGDTFAEITTGYEVVDNGDYYTVATPYVAPPSRDDSEPSYQVKNEVEGLKSSHRTAEAGETVTLTVKDGYDISDIVVTDKKGNEVDVTYKNGKYTFKMPKGGVTVTAVDNTDVFRFEDVDDGFWAEDEIYWAYEEGLMNGTSATTFNPNGKVTRQQVWMILARMSGYAPQDMAAAKGWAVATGVSDGSNPGNPVTRQQLVTLIWRAEGEPEGDLSVLADYPDAASVAAYAQEAMAWAIENGVIGGTAQGTLNPQGNANRAQLAVILYRYIG